MTPEFLFIFLLGAAAGGLINGLAGFGTALFALGFWLQIMPPPQAVAIVVVMSVASGVQGLWVVRGAILSQPRRLARFLLPALVGVPLGTSLLTILEPKALKLTVALFMIVFGGFFTLRAALPRLERPTPVIDATVGFLGGVLGGAASLSGALPTMWCAMRPWPKAETRAVLQPYNVAVLGLTALVLAWQGIYDRETLLLILIALPSTMIAAQAGIAIFRRINDDQFRRLIIAMMFISGLVLLARELLI